MAKRHIFDRTSNRPCLVFSREACFTEKERACIAQRYKNYDPKQVDQCVDVCKFCLNGTAATCNTSCKLKGAS